MTKRIHEVRSVKFSEAKRGIDYANDIQEDTNCDNLTYKGNCEKIVEDFLILKEDNPVTEIEMESKEDTSVKPGGDCENDSSQTEPIEERCVKGGRKKGETKSILEERHKARLEEQERKLIKEGVRRSQRIKDRNDANIIMEIDHYIPENFKEAMDSRERNEWHKAMEEEISEIEKHKVWTLVPRENSMKVINSKWVYSTKKTSNDAIYKRKDRLIAVGCNQRYGVDYKESFSPVLKKESLRTIVALAIQQNLIIKTYDVKTAYLYGELEETVYMRQPDGFMQKGEENKVCKLEKSLYGLTQSGKCWNKKINEILYQLGMIRTKCDPCVFKHQRGEGYAILGLYVDDLIIAGTTALYWILNVTIVDDYSNFTFVIPITNKSQTAEYITNLIKQEERQTGKKLKRIRNDNGGEYVSNYLKRWLSSKSIKQEFTTAYTPESNGKAERFNRTIVESARTMLIDSKLPIKFWSESVKVAVHINNRIEIKEINTTPFEIYKGWNPNIVYFKSREDPNLISHGNEDSGGDVYNREDQVENFNIDDGHIHQDDNDVDLITYEIKYPKDYQEAPNSDNREQWIRAMEDEMQRITKLKVWKLIDKPKDKKWIFSIKKNSDGSIENFKARLVATGYDQKLEEILEAYNLHDCNPSKTPLCISTNYDLFENSKSIDQKYYQEIVGKLIYIATRTRPDICHAIGNMSRFNKDPREVHLNGLKKILRYLKGTMNYELIYSRGDSSIVTYTDACWDRTADARSYSGFIIEMGNNLLNRKSNKQRSVALSTAESELEALSEGIKELIWTRNIIREMKINLKDQITVYCDSQNAISMINIRIKPETEVESNEWEKNDQKALATIVLSLSPPEIIHVKKCTTSAEAWKNLNKVHQPKGPATKVFLTKQLILLKINPNERLQDYLNKFSSLADRLSEMDAQVPEDFLSILLLCSLPESYEGFRTAIETRDELPSFEALKVKMLEEEIRQTQLNGTTNTEQAFLGNPERKNLPSTSKPKPRGFPFSCHFCGKKGHKAADCRKRKSRNPKNEMVASFGTKYLSKLGANEWCLDSGATAHMCSSRDSFDHFEETAPVKITLANGGLIEALGKGKVKLECSGKNGPVTLSLEDVLFVPELNGNLFSISRCTGKYNIVNFKYRKAEIVNLHTKICIQAYERNGLYILSQINCPKALATREICIAGEKNYEKWHSRFGHLNLQDLKKLKMQNIVYGLPNFDVKNFTCEVCLKDYLEGEGIGRQLSVEYTPQQNGVAERANRTLLDMTRCFMIEGDLPETLWAELIHTSTYIRNRCPKLNECKTPHELFTKRKPVVSHLKIIGSKSFAVNNRPNRSKFAPRSEEYKLIGYFTESKAYRLWKPGTRTIIKSRDVRFIEPELSRIRNEVIEIDVSPQKDPFVKEIPLVEEKGSKSEVESRTEIESESDLEMSDLVDEPSESEVIISRRGRGRPRYIRTGKPGRPRKEYPTANLSTQELLEAKYLPDPKDAEEALSGRDSYFWKKAMEEEFDSLIENKTWELVDPPKNRNIIGTKWVFKTKYNSDGSVERHKARLVAKGYSQQYGIDYEETFAPVVRQSTIRMFLALAVEYNLILHQMDVQSAYLNGEIKEEIFMTQPENFVSRKYPEKVCRLKKAIYGLKQAGIVWHEKLDTELKNLGLKQLQSDNCVYIKHDEGILLVAIYVDDLIIAAEREDTLKSFKESMKRIFKIKDLGGINCCLGIRIQMKEDGSISIDQERYIEELLAKYRMKEAKPISTPMDSNSKLTKISSIESENEPVKKVEYQSLIGSLIYLSVSTRPDIAYAVSALGQFSNDPRRQHWNAAKRVLRYLKGTSCLRITYRKSNEALHGYADADWGGNLVDRKSHTGIVYFLARGPIAWESKKQQTVTLSSTESEYIALCEAGKEAVYLRALLYEMGFGELLNGPTVLKTDNQGAQQLARNPVYHARTKHIDIKWHFIRSICSDGLVEVVHTPTQENVADILTKGLPSLFLNKMRQKRGKYRILKLGEKLDVLSDIKKGLSYTTIMQKYKISKTTVYDIKKSELKLAKFVDSTEKDVKKFSQVNQESINEWIDIDLDDPGHNVLSNDDIVEAVLSEKMEISSSDDSSSTSEDSLEPDVPRCEALK
ncbi:hypothetical protein LAZ67_13000282, partial [Cordylochernes scorpioides]